MPQMKQFITLLILCAGFYTEAVTQINQKKTMWKANTIAGPQDIRYNSIKSESSNSDSPPIMFIHGFGGNADQFRNNMPYFSDLGHDTYGIDLLGYGYSSKPSPKEFGEPNTLYNFETWGKQSGKE